MSIDCWKYCRARDVSFFETYISAIFRFDNAEGSILSRFTAACRYKSDSLQFFAKYDVIFFNSSASLGLSLN